MITSKNKRFLKLGLSIIVLYSFTVSFTQTIRNEYYRTCENFQHPLLNKIRFQIYGEDTLQGRCFRFTYKTDSKNVETLYSITHLFLGQEQPILNNDQIVGLDYEPLSLPKVSKVIFNYKDNYNLESITFKDNLDRETCNVWGVSQYKYLPLENSKSNDLFIQKRYFRGEEKIEKLQYVYKLRHALLVFEGSKKTRVWIELRRFNYNVYREYKYDIKNNQVKEIEYSEKGYFKNITVLDKKYMFEIESALYNTFSKDSISFFSDGNYHKKTSKIKLDQDNKLTLETTFWDALSKPQSFGTDGYQQKIEKYSNGFIIESTEFKNLNPDENFLKVHRIDYSYEQDKSNSLTITKSYKKKNGFPITIYNEEFPYHGEKFDYNNQGFLIRHKIADASNYFFGQNYEVLYENLANYSSYDIIHKCIKNQDNLISSVNLTDVGLLHKVLFKKMNGKDTLSYYNLNNYLGRYDLVELDDYQALEIFYKGNQEVRKITIIKEDKNDISYDFEYFDDGRKVEIIKDKDKTSRPKKLTYQHVLFKNEFLIDSLEYAYYNKANKTKGDLLWKEKFNYGDNFIQVIRTDENGRETVDKYLNYKNTSLAKEISRYEISGKNEKRISYDEWWLTPHKIVYSYDKNLNVIATKYYNVENEIISQYEGSEEVYYDSISYNEKNLIKDKYFLDKRNNIVKDNKLMEDYCALKFEYNDRNQMIAESYYIENQPIEIQSVWKNYRLTDAFGRKIKEFKLDIDSKELLNESGNYSRIKYEYFDDDPVNYRKIKSKSFFNEDKPALNREGYHKIEYEYNRLDGTNLGYKYFGTKDSKDVPMLKKDRNFHYEKIQSSDSLIEKSFYNYDSDKEAYIPSSEFSNSNVHLYKYWPDKENSALNAREEFYGINNQLIDNFNSENGLTYAIGEYKFNSDGDTIVIKRYLKNKMLIGGCFVEINYSAGKNISKNDQFEKKIEYHYKTSSTEYAKRKVQIKQFNYFSNKIEIRNLNAKRKLVPDEKGVASYTLDKFGNIIEKFDAKDRKIN